MTRFAAESISNEINFAKTATGARDSSYNHCPSTKLPTQLTAHIP
ncbi:hypothetical protein Pla52n_57360 [Stieleria varia]|uniref:Uncharacterized protein n=1 Tax=Stieleria varia TaxID=2528005 RepID=A0A5C6A3S2_9BACT|nr:hypothetical protein Pla52n_57360 [Stieleria varia]